MDDTKILLLIYERQHEMCYRLLDGDPQDFAIALEDLRELEEYICRNADSVEGSCQSQEQTFTWWWKPYLEEVQRYRALRAKDKQEEES